jgi:hypothetical protein
LWPGQARKADRRDYAYVYLAWATESPDPCYLIPEDVHSVAALGPRGMKITLTRSDCFGGVAANSGRADLCEHVISVSSILWDGSRFSRERCLKESQSAGHPVLIGAPHPIDEFMLHLGYRLDPVPQGCRSVVTHPRLDVDPDLADPDLRQCAAQELWLRETQSKRILDRLDLVRSW